MTAESPSAARTRSEDRMAWFNRLWAVAVLAHVLGNGPNADLFDASTWGRVALFVLGVAGIAVLVVPRSRTAVTTLAFLVLLTAWLEAPFLANHWQLAALVSLLLLVAQLRKDSWEFFSRNARYVLLAFYAFAAFAKLNSDFFDPVVSCARVYANEALGAVGLPKFGSGGALAGAPGWGSALIEISVVPLLSFARTRFVGITVAMVFHFAISLDFDQHFFDFTAVLLALFTLFLSDGTLDRLSAWQPSERLRGLFPGLLLALVYMSVSSPSTGAAGLTRLTAFVLWVPAGGLIVWRSLRGGRARRDIGRPGIAGGAVALTVIMIGTLPYIGVRTATAWNMYSNLRTHDGASNHYVVPSVGTLRLDADDFVEVLGTNDAALEPYVGTGLLVPAMNLRHYLALHPDATAEVRLGGAPFSASAETWGDRQPVFARKFLFARSTVASGASECQTTFLPAG